MLIKIVGENAKTVNYIVYQPSELSYKYENGKNKIALKKGKIKSAISNIKFDDAKADLEIVVKVEEKRKIIETDTLNGDAVVQLEISVIEKYVVNDGNKIMMGYELVPSEEVFKKSEKIELEAKREINNDEREKNEQKKSILRGR